MKSTQDYVKDVDSFLLRFLKERSNQLSEISPEAQELTEYILELALGGKRMRAQLCYLGYLYASGTNYPAIVTAGAAIEMFQTAALIHDDIIDSSETRRGKTTIHTRYQQQHQDENLAGSPEEYGIATAILGGDLCLSFSEEIFAQASELISETYEARKIFNTMRYEVMAGQFMDIHEETAFNEPHDLNAYERAFNVLTFKSAKYSVEHPLVIGAALADASQKDLQQLADFGLPLGQAFQLRDDLLGVFGEPQLTGKPAGDDIKEGKRTVLIAFTLENSSEKDIKFINSHLGDASMNSEELEKILHIIQQSQAPQRCETLINKLTAQSYDALAKLHENTEVTQELKTIAQRLTQRDA
ncbi:MAG: polyprenyl synthetase family protein [Micrococcaceae bacterium]